jgi:hypothetical protein
MNEICGCCKGIHKLTPVTRLNRPGLDALSYRVGTHASFLETMKARLSNLELPPESFEGGKDQVRWKLRPLLELRTRDSSDPAIALLDAWATIADVLTFYQERIANEGFLPTATERRSILELARLIGYRLRPGVAASVFFAYTLEQDSAVEIPAGARAQSVPGSGTGELPQSFETSDKLLARTEWNTLQVRLTRPQNPQNGRPLYFKGTSTNLKQNDPLLIDFGKQQGLFRVTAVEADQVAGRTKVSVEDWAADPTLAPASSAIATGASGEGFIPATAAEFVARLQEILDRFTRAEEFDVNSTTQTAQRVLGQLSELGTKAASINETDELQQTLDATLKTLAEDRQLAVEGNFTKLLPWIEGLVAELNQVSGDLAQAGSAAIALVGSAPQMSAVALNQAGSNPSGAASSPANQSFHSSLTDIGGVISNFEKAASQPPASSRQLDRKVTGSFSSSSDTLPKLLVTLRPALRDVFYRAWENLSISAPVPTQVYALRVRASVFGNNAPLKPVINKETGRVISTEEWTLFKDTVSTTTEKFNINIVFSNQTQSFDATVTLTTEAGGAIGSTTSGKKPISNPPLQLKGIPNEEVDLTVSVGDKGEGATFTFDFKVRKFQVVIDWERSNDSRHIKVSTTGSSLVNVEPTATAGSLFGPGNSVNVDGTVSRTLPQIPTEDPNKVSLDASYKEILPGSWAVFEESSGLIITKIKSVREASRADYGISGPGTQLEVVKKWISPGTAPGIPAGSNGFEVIRGTRVFAQSELLELAEEPIDPNQEPVCGKRIELANLVKGLESGRWLIVTGERVDIKSAALTASDQPTTRNLGKGGEGKGEATGVAGAGVDGEGVATDSDADGTSDATNSSATLKGITATELVMLSGVEQGYDESLPGDKTHTTLLLANDGLTNCYKRDTVTIYGNVTKATHGETKSEVLGSGDASQSMQQFTLHQKPLTYLAAPTPAGSASTLQVRVNGLLWHETDDLVVLGPKDRCFITFADDKDQTAVTFGNGKYGARLPTGIENVTAVYRAGIGQPGNVKAEQITSLLSKPLGVKSVINPLAASGGADREGRDQARRNAPIAVTALDRLVSVQDYEDFARTYAGIAKAISARLSDGRRQLVHLTIAGSDDIPIAPTSDLFLNLRQALRKFGDPYQSIQIAVRKLKLLVISAKVRLQADYSWEFVEPVIRAALLDKFSFDRRELGQDALPSEALSVIQAQAGVAYVDLDIFDSVSEDTSSEELEQLGASLGLHIRILVSKAKIDRNATDPAKRILAAELAYLSAAVADTLILTELTK